MLSILGMFGLYAVAFDVILIFLNIISFVFLGVILYSLCETNGLKDKGILSFIPLLNIYIINELLGERVHVKIRNNLWIIYGIFLVMSLFIPKLGIVTLVILGYYMYLMFKELEENYKIHTLLGVLTSGISFPVSLYKYRKSVIEVSTRDSEESLSEIVMNIRNSVNQAINGEDDNERGN